MGRRREQFCRNGHCKDKTGIYRQLNINYKGVIQLVNRCAECYKIWQRQRKKRADV